MTTLRRLDKRQEIEQLLYLVMILAHALQLKKGNESKTTTEVEDAFKEIAVCYLSYKLQTRMVEVVNGPFNFQFAPSASVLYSLPSRH